MEMNSRERMLAAVNRKPLDRIPTDIWAVPEVSQKLSVYFGEGVDIREQLHIDGMANVEPAYIGPPLSSEVPEDESIDFWGVRKKRTAYEGGTYEELSFYPLAEAETLDDLGSQTGPLIGMGLYREFYAPHHKRFIELCHEFGIKVFHHDDGSCRQFLPLLVDMGIDILNPVQWTCPGMDMAELKAEFGGRICFHGAVENQKILPFGTPGDVRAEVRHCIDTLAADGTGYILAPCHNIQVNTPVENIIAMYDEAWNYGNMG